MNVSELKRLADWFVDIHSQLLSHYQALLDPIQHNANNPNKQTVENQLDALLVYLRSMTFDELSLQQLEMLKGLEIEKFIGNEGARYVEDSIRTAEYDPATAVSRITTALQKLNEAHSGFTEYQEALKSLGIDSADSPEAHDSIIIRVGFQNDAAIRNVTNWKDSAKDWYEIIRGLALASDEAPEDTEIIGASTGSIILILAGTLSVTTLLALISKNIASVTKEVIGIQGQVEDLRHKKWLNATIEKEFKKQEEGLKDKALAEIVELIKARLPNLNGEQVTALEGSIKKLLAFNEKGGNVDFVAPDVDGSEGSREKLTEVLAAIRGYQTEREQIKSLTDQRSSG
jgi:hypothetical protein